MESNDIEGNFINKNSLEEKENYQDDNQMEVDAYIPSHPGSPTLQGLLDIGRSSKEKSYITSNLSVKICNCTEYSVCDHQEISIIVDKTDGESKHMTKTLALNNRLSLSTITNGTVERPKSFTKPKVKASDSVCDDNAKQSNSESTCDDNDRVRNYCSTTIYQDKSKENGANNELCEMIDYDNYGSSNSQHFFQPPSDTNSQQKDKMRKLCDNSAPFLDLSKNKDYIIFKRPKNCSSAGPNYFDNLQNEVVLYIFQYLPKQSLVRLAQTCKRFQKLAFDFSLWRRVDMNNKILGCGALGRVILRGVQYLRLSKADISEVVFSPPVQHLPPFQSSILYLDLSMANCKIGVLHQILSVCRALRKLSLEFLSVNDGVMSQVANNLQLDTLNLAMCEGLTSPALLNVFRNCKLLRYLNLAWTGLTHDDFTEILPRIPSCLERLNLSGFREELRDRHVKLLCSRATALADLDLSDCSELTQHSITFICTDLKELVSLTLNRCYAIGIEVLLELNKLPHLQVLNLFGIVRPGNICNLLTNSLVGVHLNKHMFSTIARPTVGVRRTSIWLARVRDS